MLSMPEPTSLIYPLTTDKGTCGYCGPAGVRSVKKTNFHAANCVARRLSCRVSPSLPSVSSLVTLTDFIVRAARRFTRR